MAHTLTLRKDGSITRDDHTDLKAAAAYAVEEIKWELTDAVRVFDVAGTIVATLVAGFDG